MSTENEVGSIWMLHILSALATRWPLPTQLVLEDIMADTGRHFDDDDESNEAFDGLVKWLMSEGLVVGADAIQPGFYYGAMLTQAGHAVLGLPSPSAPQTSLRDRVVSTAADIALAGAKEGTKTVAKDLAKNAVTVASEVMGAFTGSFFRGASGGTFSV